MKLSRLGLGVCLAVMSAGARAQSGVGTVTPDADKALHVRASASQDPLRLEGLRQGVDGETDIVVTDVNGRLRYRPLDDLTVKGEWRDSTVAGTPLIYAAQARQAGNAVVVTDAGRFGIGTQNPAAPFHIGIAGDQMDATGGGIARFGGDFTYIGIDENEIQAISLGAVAPLNFNPDGGEVRIGSAVPATSLLDAYGRVQVRTLDPGDLDGLNPADDEIVTATATGLLRKVPASAINGMEWRNHSSDQYIYALRAQQAGQNIVVTDAGRLGVGTTTPGNRVHIPNGGLLLGNNVRGAMNPNERGIRFSDGNTSDGLITVQDGSGRFNFKWNATYGTGERFLAGTDYATKLMIGGFAQNDPEDLLDPDGDVFRVATSSVVGTAGAPITWRYPFTIENTGEVGIGTTNPGARFHVDGSIKFDANDLPVGAIAGVPATDPQVLLLDPNTDEVMRIGATDLFDDEGEWVDDASGNFIYARRARDEGSTDFVVVDDDGEFGIGLTAPTAKLHLRDGGIRIDGETYGIGFNGENPYSADPIGDGSRIYHENNTTGTWQDALIIEKTDFNHSAVDGGIVFANRQAGNIRNTTVAIRGDGEVAIGNNFTNPTERLHVLGKGLFQEGGTGTSADRGMVKVVDDRDPIGDYERGVQAVDERRWAYFGMEPRASGTAHDAAVMWGSDNSTFGQQQDLHFVNRRGAADREVMMMDGEFLNVGIGTVPVASAATKLHVGGRVRVDDLNPQVAFDEANDLIVIADVNGELQTVTSAVFKQDFEDLDWVIDDKGNGNPADDEIYNANAAGVGIGLTDPANGIKLHVSGPLRMENASAIQLDDADVRLLAPNDGELSVEAHTTTTFEHRSATGIDPMVVDHQNGIVDVGIGRAGTALSMRVEGVLRMGGTSEVQFGSNSNNMIYADDADDFRVTANKLWSVRTRNDGTGVLTVDAQTRRVGINTNTPGTGANTYGAIALDVDGSVRVRRLRNAASADEIVTVDANGELRKRAAQQLEGPWLSADGTPGRTYLRDATDHVGIGTNNPTSTLHIVEGPGTPATPQRGTITLEHTDAGGQSSIVFKSRANNNSDYGYINFRDDNPDHPSTRNENALLEIGVGNDNAGGSTASTYQDDIAIMPTGRLGVRTRYPTRVTDIDGDLRVRRLIDSPTDVYALTADADGNVNRQDITAIKDNLGNHVMLQSLQAGDNTISYGGSNAAGIKLTDQNSTMISNRFQLGNLSANWIDDNITKLPPELTSGTVTNGFAGNDGAIFAPVRTGSETSDLRLYILDNPNDQFSVWGNPCPSADCGEINNSNRVASFRADGRITLDGLATGGGPNQMVLADANGRLLLGGAPGSTTTGGGDNLGNHTATQNLNLGPHQLRTQAGTRIEGNTGNINFPDSRGLFWGSIYSTAITGDVQANGEGGQSDLRFESGDDMFFQSRGGGGDFLIRTADYVARASNYMRFHVGTDNNNDDFRFYTESNSTNVDNANHGATNGSIERLRIQNDGDVQIFGLDDPGNGDALVGVDEDGVLFRQTTSSDGLWDRDAANAETFLRNAGDDVGIGTADPSAPLHVRRNSGAVGARLLLDNGSNNGDSEVSFRENNGSRGIDLNYDGGDERLYIRDAGGQRLVSIERAGGDVGIGRDNPVVQLHVQRTIANGAQSDLDAPARIRIQNEAAQGSSGVEFVEGGGNGLDGNNGMSVRYNSSGDGLRNALEVVRGDVEQQTPNYVHLRIERNSGQTTIRHLGTTVPTGGTEMVIADGNGVLSTQPLATELWDTDDTDSEFFLASAYAGYSVGIGTNAPQAKLDVNGDARVRGLAGAPAGLTTDHVVTVDPATGQLRTRAAADFENYWTRDALTGALYPGTSSDNVGIGESNPAAKLHVGGDLIVEALPAGTVGTDDILVVDGATGQFKKVPAGSFDDFWRRDDAGAQDYVELATASDFVSLGVAGAPTAQFHTTGTVRFAGLGSPDHALVTDASGNVSTRAFPDTYWSRDPTNGYTFTDFSSDNVGIGTSTPSAKLHVASGSVRIEDLASNTGDALADRIVTTDGAGNLRSLPAGTLYSPWIEDVNNRVKLRNNDHHVGIGTQSPLSVLHVEDDIANSAGAMEVRLQNRQGNGEINLRFRTGANSGGTSDENNSMVLRYTNQYDAMEITNGFAAADVNYSSYFKVRRANGHVGIGVGTLNPVARLTVGPPVGSPGNGDVRLLNGDLDIKGDARRIEFAETNSYLRDMSNNLNPATDGDLELRGHDDLFLTGSNDLTVRALGDDLTVSAADEVAFRAGGAERVRVHNDGRLEVFNGGNPVAFENDGGSLLRGNVRAQNNVRVDGLGGGGTQMVVADNAGNLGVQAIPTFTDTDDQVVAYDVSTGNLTLTRANNPTITLPLGSAVAIDDQDLTFAAGVLGIDNGATTVDLNPYLDNTDAQVLSLAGNTLAITGSAPTVDLSGYVNTDAQALSLAGNTLAITGSAATVDLAAYLDDTDDQTLSISGNDLTIADGNTVTLPTPVDTDDQQLTYDGATGLLSLTDGGTPVQLAFGVSGSAAATVAGLTDVGIGTTAAPANLAVSGALTLGTLAPGAATDSLLTVDATGAVRRRSLGALGTQIGVFASALTQNLNTDGRYVSGNGANGGLFVDASNRVVVGGATAIAGSRLSVVGDVYATGDLDAFSLTSVDLTATDATLTNASVTDATVTDLTFTTGYAADDLLTVDAAGQVGFINRSVVSGAVVSDERLKTDLAPMTGALDGIARLRNVSYRYRTGLETPGLTLDTATHYGLIAQDVAAVFPHAVTRVGDYLTLEGRELTGILFAAANELRAANADLTARNTRLEAELATLRAAKTDLERDVHGLRAETAELQSQMTTVLQHIEASRHIQATER